MNIKYLLGALLLLLTIGVIDASAQSSPPLSPKRIRLQGQAAPPTPNPPTGYYNIWVDSATGSLNITDSAGTDTVVGAPAGVVTAASTLTAGRITQATDADSIENSKMLAAVGGASTGKGVWTLYDDTATNGVSGIVLRAGAAQGTVPSPLLNFFANNGSTVLGQTTNKGYIGIGAAGTDTSGLNIVATTGMTQHITLTGVGGIINPVMGFNDASGGTHTLTASGGIWGVSDNVGSLYFRIDAGETAATPGIRLGAGATGDTGIYRGAAGRIKFTVGDSTAAYGDVEIGRAIQGTSSTVLDEGVATSFVDIAVASGVGIGGRVDYTVETTDGTNRTIESGTLAFSSINLDGGTVDDADVGVLGTPVQSTSAANTFVNTFSVTSGSDKITLKCSSATTLAGTDVITIRYRVVVNRGTATVTPIA